MGQEDEQVDCIKWFFEYQVNLVLMDWVDLEVLFMYCLFVYWGEEVSYDMFDDFCVVVWDEVENWLYVQKVLLEFLFIGMY